MACSWAMSLRFTSMLFVCALVVPTFAPGCYDSGEDPKTGAGSDAGALPENDAATTDKDSGGTTTQDAATVSDSATVDKNTVTVSDFKYTPSSLTIKVGETVTWKWTSGSHTVTSGTNCVRDDKFDSESFPSPHTFERKFDEAGTFEYFCDYKDHCQKGQVGVIKVEP